MRCLRLRKLALTSTAEIAQSMLKQRKNQAIRLYLFLASAKIPQRFSSRRRLLHYSRPWMDGVLLSNEFDVSSNSLSSVVYGHTTLDSGYRFYPVPRSADAIHGIR